VLAGSLLCVSARADQWDKKTILTVNQPIQVEDTLLQPGKYVFKLLDSQSDRHVVQIFNADQSQIINTVLAIPKQRMEPTGDSQFSFWETPAGSAKALRAWFYPGDTIGNEFPYPAHLQQLAMVTPPEPPAPVASAPPAETPAPPPTPPVPEPQATANPPDQDQPAETPQTVPANPPDQTQATTPPEQSSADRTAPAELPKTASPYPLIGFCGIALAGFGLLLRLRRTA
jgi:hypothetical protein